MLTHTVSRQAKYIQSKGTLQKKAKKIQQIFNTRNYKATHVVTKLLGQHITESVATACKRRKTNKGDNPNLRGEHRKIQHTKKSNIQMCLLSRKRAISFNLRLWSKKYKQTHSLEPPFKCFDISYYAQFVLQLTLIN